MKKRSSGILMGIPSLPSPYGIGTMGKTAREWVDFLHSSGQSWWQILPLGPTSYGDSPYQSFSSAAGNPYLIDLDILVEEGLLKKEEIDERDWGKDKERVDYGAIYTSRFSVLHLAYERAREERKAEIQAFREENKDWVEDYALFMALKKHFGMKSWIDWPDESIRKREKESVERYRNLLSDDISFYAFMQYLFFRQWNALRSYAKDKGIGIIGDVPIYVALDSADVWTSPEMFQLDASYYPEEVSGVPPDYFNADGQLWGNPLYAWDRMKEDNYSWWKQRISYASRLYDMIRFDHFRGLESYYAIPYGEKTARKGRWVKGPGRSFTDELNKAFPHLHFNAEDLGYMSQEVKDLLSASTWPGMKILMFGFDGREEGQETPEFYKENTVCYTGTHDNTTLMGWLSEIPPEIMATLKKRFGDISLDEIRERIIQEGEKSRSFLMVVPIQDWLGLGKEARINTPGTASGNWQWRLSSMSMLDGLAPKIRKTIGDRAE